MALAAFTLNGTRYELTSDVAEARLAGVAPEPICEHAVQANELWYPGKQAFEVAVGCHDRNSSPIPHADTWQRLASHYKSRSRAGMGQQSPRSQRSLA